MPQPQNLVLVFVPATVGFGETFVATLTADPPLPEAAVLTGKVTLDSGGTNQIDGNVTLTDPIATFELLDLAARGFTIVARPAEPGVFDVTAPAT